MNNRKNAINPTKIIIDFLCCEERENDKKKMETTQITQIALIVKWFGKNKFVCENVTK